MNHAVVVLNTDFSIINVVSWKRAFNLILKGKAEVVEKTERTVKNFEGNFVFEVPAVIKLINFVKNIYKASVTFNKTNIMVRDNFTCCYCPSKENLTIDHVIPRSKGGKTTWINCVTCCKKCNMQKGSKQLRDTNMVLKAKPYQISYVEFLKKKIELFGFKALTKKFR